MAAPRVFISSTCFDLAEVRDSLISFCQGFGFEVVMSDKGDVFYHPDLHTHDSCINEISNCQLFILIIGGRFGGKYKVDSSKSITNAEYNAAKELGIPVFTFVKEGVLADHHLFQKNKDKEFISNIDFPSIEKKEYAESIFKFIDLVRSADVNNGFFGFKYARDLHESLRKQWAGMFFEFLTQRTVSNQLRTTNESISNLSIASKKIEALVKHVYKEVDKVGATESIEIIDAESEAEKFFSTIASEIRKSHFINANQLENLSETTESKWWKFLTQLGEFEYQSEVYSENRCTSGITYKETWVADIDGELSEKEEKLTALLGKQYQNFLELSTKSKRNVMSKYVL